MNADLLGLEIRSDIVLSLIKGMKKSCIWNLRVEKQFRILWKLLCLIGVDYIVREGILFQRRLYTSFRHIIEVTRAIVLLVIMGCDDVRLL